VEVPAGEAATLRLAIGCHLAGVVTTRLEGRYLYTRHYSDIEDVLGTALEGFDEIVAGCAALDGRLLESGLSADQQFIVAHATRSYYGATELLEVDGRPYWVVNEGEYCMMNTLDLAVDQVFWELEQNPWVVRNLLDGFVKRYSYRDEVKDPETGARSPGGISFCHDQGVHNQFSPLGTSAYELPELTGCFSYMTQEELCNWVLMAASYVARTGDGAWARANEGVIRACGQSMLARDHADADRRTGITQRDSARCGSGREITSYDSLDASLAQTRGNLYIAVKCWATYLGLQHLFAVFGGAEEGGQWSEAAYRSAKTVEGHAGADGWIPAIFDEGGLGHAARILPAIEGILFPRVWGNLDALTRHGRHAGLLNVLARHTATLLADPERRNKFADGGVRLSSTSDNSWASKIAIVQHVARGLFNLDENGVERKSAGATGWERADATHVRWQVEGASAYWAASDQIVNGVARGSKYYPRLITAALWLREK
jgi:hypothetical protein